MIGQCKMGKDGMVGEFDDDIEEGIPYITGNILWAVYQFITFIVLLSVLRARMVNTYHRIFREADVQWKFFRWFLITIKERNIIWTNRFLSGYFLFQCSFQCSNVIKIKDKIKYFISEQVCGGNILTITPCCHLLSHWFTFCMQLADLVGRKLILPRISLQQIQVFMIEKIFTRDTNDYCSH